MKNAINKVSSWVLGVFVPRVDAGACFPPDCCAWRLKLNCAGFCVNQAGNCTPDCTGC